MNRFTLAFGDAAMEARYRASEDGRCVRVTRVGSLAGVVLLLAMGVLIDLFAPRELKGVDSYLKLMAAGAAMIGVGYFVSYVPTLNRWPQPTVAFLCVFFSFAMAAYLDRAPAEFAAHRGFMFLMLHLFSIYTLLRLRIVPATVAGCLSVAAYLGVLHLKGTIPHDAWQRHAFWLLVANIWGILICYQIDQSSRREFAAKAALEREQERSEHLLLNILPAAIAARLKDSHEPIAEHRDGVTVLFADIVGFTPLSARLSPGKLVALLDDVFTRFDGLAREHGLEKIKTIGDAYMAVAGLPHEQADHALRAARMAMAMVATVRDAAHATGEALELRVGMHTGPVVAGVIGRSKFSYDLWGDTVNTASRMESSGIPGRVQCTDVTAASLAGHLALESRGEIDVKGKGRLEAFLLPQA